MGPSEVFYFEQGTGLKPNSSEYMELWGNWTITTWESLAAVHAAGGYTWSNINCMLDVEHGNPGTGQFGNLAQCGLMKTARRPRANNTESSPLWQGSSCAAWLRVACNSSSVFHKIPTLLAFTNASTYRHRHGGNPFPALLQDVARFLLVRGEYAWLGYGWEGCITTAPPVAQFDHDYGTPLEICYESAPGV